MTLMHIVLFKLNTTLSEAEVTEFCEHMVSLKEKCVHPETNKPYILAVSGGKDNSPEGKQGGFTHGFVVEFVTASDRDYYVSQDPAHKAFGASAAGKYDDVCVIDYHSGQF